MATTDGRYVKNAYLFEAMKGRELEVLRAIGINWDASRTHIRCPYPDHQDENPSWRFDGRLTYCTCIGTRPGDKKAHNIVRVVEVYGRCGNDAAKIRIAEILGLSDLIKTK